MLDVFISVSTVFTTTNTTSLCKLLSMQSSQNNSFRCLITVNYISDYGKGVKTNVCDVSNAMRRFEFFLMCAKK